MEVTAEQYNALRGRVDDLERILAVVLHSFRQTAIMNTGAIEAATGLDRTRPPRKDKGKKVAKQPARPPIVTRQG